MGEKEIGSFIELEFAKGLEYYHGEQIARLNSGRAAILHAMRILKLNTLYLPFYQCESVRNFLLKYGIKIRYYHIDSEFNPMLKNNTEDTAILLVNYFGIMSYERMSNLASKYQNVIIDNAQAFFALPVENCINVYSARKFIGVADGAYLIGDHVTDYVEEYEQDYSSDTSLFLLQRIEYGCEGKAYQTKKMNDERINHSTIKKMSKLTQMILDGTDYDIIQKMRKDNFETACMLFDRINQINPRLYFAGNCIPMVYPLVIEKDEMLQILIDNKIFQGRWWTNLLDEVHSDDFEYYLSNNMIPITIDQRYVKKDLDDMYDLIVRNT
jgi:hypothetical protein